MLSEIEQEEFKQAHRAINARIVHNATLHMDGLEAREIAVLQIAGSIIQKPITDFDVQLTNILLELDIKSLVETYPGPYLFYVEQNETNNRFGFEIANGLFDNNDLVRMKCIARLLNLAVNEKAFGASTKTVLATYKDTLASSDERVWKEAAIACWDALHADPCYHALAIRQADTMRYEDGFDRHLRRILNVSRDFVEENIRVSLAPFGEGELKAARNSLRSCSNLAELCQEFASSYGSLPFSSPISFDQVLNEWDAAHGASTLEDEIFALLEHVSDPDQLFLLCSGYLRRKGGVVDERSILAMRLILDFLPSVERKSSSTVAAYWELRAELARYYFFSFRVSLPSVNDADLSLFSWCLATRVCKFLRTTDDAMDYFRENLVTPAADAGSVICTLAGIEGQKWSLLGALFRSPGDPWQTALISLLGELHSTYRGLASIDDFEERYSKQLPIAGLQHVINMLSLKSAPMYQLQSSGIPDFCKYSLTYGLSKELHEALIFFLDSCLNCAAEDKIHDLLRSIANHELDRSNAITLAILKYRLGFGNVNFDLIWSTVKDHEWLDSYINSTSEEDVQSFLDMIVVGMTGERAEWRFEIPHRLAHLCKEDMGKGKQSALFGFVFSSCFQLGATSALEDLMNRRHELDLDSERVKYVELIRGIQAHSPHWIKSRARMLLATLVDV